MVKRGVPVKQISVSPETYNRFITYQEYNKNNEGILIMLMNEADKYRKSAHRNHNK